MTTTQPLRRFVSLVALVALAAFLTACGMGGDGDGDTDSTSYALSDGGGAGTVTGTVTFTKVDESTTEVVIDLDGVTEGNHPAHIHQGNVGSGGAIVVGLTPVDASGMSTTTVTAFEAGSPESGAAVTYEGLIAYDGYVNVHQSASDLGTIVATGEVGAGATGGEEED